MKSTTHAPLALMLLGVLSACGESDRSTPIAPSPVVAPNGPARGPGTGTIALRDRSPAPGATLAVQSTCPAGFATRMCTDQWRGAFDVTVDREMPFAVLTVRFYDGQAKCGYGAATVESLPAGESVTLHVARIFLSDEYGTFTQPCPLPATTNRIEVELWSDSSTWTNTLVQVFDESYTFSRP